LESKNNTKHKQTKQQNTKTKTHTHKKQTPTQNTKQRRDSYQLWGEKDQMRQEVTA